MAACKQAVKQAMVKIVPFRLAFTGVTASSGSVMVQGFDESGELNRLREILRKNFQNSSLKHGIDSRYKTRTAHLTVIRFAKQLDQPGMVVNQLKNTGK